MAGIFAHQCSHRWVFYFIFTSYHAFNNLKIILSRKFSIFYVNRDNNEFVFFFCLARTGGTSRDKIKIAENNGEVRSSSCWNTTIKQTSTTREASVQRSVSCVFFVFFYSWLTTSVCINAVYKSYIIIKLLLLCKPIQTFLKYYLIFYE